jgi:hypothetical protein
MDFSYGRLAMFGFALPTWGLLVGWFLRECERERRAKGIR